MQPQPGTPVHCAMTKWGGRPHWEFDARVLGEDEHGLWLGFPSGTRYVRPGMDFRLNRDHVGLVPAGAAWFLATFYATEGDPWPQLESGVQVYVDMTTPAEWDGTTLRAVDLDLDVVRGFNGRVVVDDEDEFEEHRVALGYPVEVVAGARSSCEQVHAALVAAQAPYDGSHRRWLDALAGLA